MTREEAISWLRSKGIRAVKHELLMRNSIMASSKTECVDGFKINKNQVLICFSQGEWKILVHLPHTDKEVSWNFPNLETAVIAAFEKISTGAIDALLCCSA